MAGDARSVMKSASRLAAVSSRSGPCLAASSSWVRAAVMRNARKLERAPRLPSAPSPMPWIAPPSLRGSRGAASRRVEGTPSGPGSMRTSSGAAGVGRTEERVREQGAKGHRLAEHDDRGRWIWRGALRKLAQRPHDDLLFCGRPAMNHGCRCVGRRGRRRRVAPRCEEAPLHP